VNAVEPLLTFRNGQGEIEGVKYDQLSAVLVNAIKEQQEEINALQDELARQRQTISRQQEEFELLLRRLNSSR
jgi:septal ring factor EnvC (AmiA/AmiB activator)